jgi:C4-dicarboxylate-specific signal transduction histidine kinase
MGAFSNPERHADDSKFLAQFSGDRPHQPGPVASDAPYRKALEQLPSLVRAWIQDATTEKDGALRAIFQVITEPLFLLDRERKIVTCNEAAARQIGRTVQELVGVALSECRPPVVSTDAWKQRMTYLAEAFRSAAPVRFTDESAGRVYENAICPVLDSNGRVAAVVVAIREGTAHGRDRQGLPGSDESMQRAERLASLGMISATLAHELAQPLSVVQLATQNAMAELEKLTCPDVVKRDLQAGLAACARMGAILGRFRDLARPPGKARETEVHILQVAERTFRLLEHSARQAKVRLATENLDALPSVRMREDDLDDLFFALVQNAVQAADGAKERHLLITGTLQGDAVVLRFQDNCGGIEPAHPGRIFEPFFTTKPSDKGTGLGLCIARRIACQRGGQITAESRYGEGTTFTVTLPREASPGPGGQYVP